MEDQLDGVWVQQRSNLRFLESESNKINAPSNLLMFENKKVLNSFFISRQFAQIAFSSSDTMVVLQHTFKGEIEDHKSSFILLINLKTNQMKTFKFKFVIKHFYMDSQNQLFYINSQKVSLDIYSLAENTLIRRIPLKSVENINNCMAPLIFHETQHFCILEQTKPGISEIAFYDYKQGSNLKQPFATYTAPVPMQKVFQLNRSSKIGWQVGKKMSDQIRIQTFVGSQRRTNSTQIYSFSLQNLIPKLGLKQKQLLIITKMRQTKKNDFLIKVQVDGSKTNGNQQFQQAALFNNNRNNNMNNMNSVVMYKNDFVLKTNGETQTIDILESTTQKTLTFGENSIFRVKDFQSCGNYSYFLIQNTNLFIPEKCIITVDNLCDEIIQKVLNRLQIQKTRFLSEGSHFLFQGDTRITNYVCEDYQNKMQIRILSKTIFQYKMMYIHQLLKINEDFDDDLLQDALDLLQVQSAEVENPSG